MTQGIIHRSSGGSLTLATAVASVIRRDLPSLWKDIRVQRRGEGSTEHGDMKSGLATFLTGLALLIPAWIGLLISGVPTSLSPLPALTVLPAFVLASWHLWRVAVTVPSLVFFAWNPGLFRGESKVPKRSVGLLATAALLDVVWFVEDWNYGLLYQGAKYTYLVCGINIAWVAVLGAMFAHCWKSKSSFKFNLVLHWLLFAWLAWYAFPYLGELP